MKAVLVLFMVLALAGCASFGGGIQTDPLKACASAQRVVDVAKADVDVFCVEGMMSSDDCRTARIAWAVAKSNLALICP